MGICSVPGIALDTGIQQRAGKKFTCPFEVYILMGETDNKQVSFKNTSIPRHSAVKTIKISIASGMKEELWKHTAQAISGSFFQMLLPPIHEICIDSCVDKNKHVCYQLLYEEVKK